jgi:hypothetical protein
MARVELLEPADRLFGRGLGPDLSRATGEALWGPHDESRPGFHI